MDALVDRPGEGPRDHGDFGSGLGSAFDLMPRGGANAPGTQFVRKTIEDSNGGIHGF